MIKKLEIQADRLADSEVLVVDDDPTSRHLLSAILSKRGYQVRTANDGAAALTAVLSSMPDLVLLDVSMPYIDGYDVCRRLKQDERTVDIPVIFISAQEEMRDKMRAFAAGGVDYILKPFHAEEVLARVQTHLSLLEARRRQQTATESLHQHIKELALSNEELETLREVAEYLNQAITMSDVAHDALKRILTRLGARAGWLLLARDSGHASIAATYNLPWSQDATGDGCGTSEIHRLLGQLPPDNLTDPRLISVQQHVELARGMRQAQEEMVGFMRDYVCIPLQMRDRFLGVLNVVLPDGTQFDEHRRKLYKTIGDQYSAALERARLFEGVQRLARTDSLTGLFNRRHFFAAAQQEYERTKRYRHQLSVIMIDIDHFKAVNDTYGHAVGDQVLRGIARLVVEDQRSVDVIGRIGGEEFVILLPETAPSDARNAAERLRRTIENSKFDTSAGPIGVTVSLGIASLPQRGEVTLQRLLDNADEALYQSKAAGRNRVVVYED